MVIFNSKLLNYQRVCVFTMGSLEHVHNMCSISMSVITLQAPFCNGSFSSTPLPSYTQLFSTDAWYSCDTIPTPKMFKNSCCLPFGIPEWVDIPLSSTFLATFSGWLLEHQDLDVAGDATPRRTVASLRNGDGQLQLCGSECVVGPAKCKPFQFIFFHQVSVLLKSMWGMGQRGSVWNIWIYQMFTKPLMALLVCWIFRISLVFLKE